MNLISKKFKYLLRAQKLLGQSRVPLFHKIESMNGGDSAHYPAILRSALHGEADETSLCSGKSLSISGISSQSDLLEALQKIYAQPFLEEVILQKEILWDSHITMVYEEDFFFVEVKGREEDLPRFSYWTPIGQTHDDSGLLSSLKNMIDELTNLLKEHPLWLMELGQNAEGIFLFQIQPVSIDFLGDLFSQNLVQKMLLSRQRFQRQQSLLGMLKTEWKAHRFRAQAIKGDEKNPSSIFINWEFIFHYFRIYCLLKNIKPDQQSFASFLAVGHTNNWMGEVLRKHFSLANQLRLHETYDAANFIFDHDSSLIFIGKGKYEGEATSASVLLIEDLTPEIVYSIKDHKIILTKTVSLLSHGILAAIESKIMVVAGIPQEQWNSLGGNGRICLDFEERLLQIK